MATHSSILASPAPKKRGSKKYLGFPGGSDGKAPAFNVGDLDSIPGPGKSPGEGNGNPLQYSCLENPMDRWAWSAIVHAIAKSRTRLSYFSQTNRDPLFSISLYNWLTFSPSSVRIKPLHKSPLWPQPIPSNSPTHHPIYYLWHVCVLSCFSHVQLFATQWTVAHQTP